MLENIPKPVVIGVAAVLILFAVFMLFRTAKSGGGDGDYNKDEIQRQAKLRESQPNQGRTMPAQGTMGMRSGSPSSSGSPTSAGMSGSSK